jgi:hypothetical protein
MDINYTSTSQLKIETESSVSARRKNLCGYLYSFSKGLCSQKATRRKIHDENAKTSVLKNPGERRHGFEFPFHWQQYTVWIFSLLLATNVYAILLPALFGLQKIEITKRIE